MVPFAWSMLVPYCFSVHIQIIYFFIKVVKYAQANFQRSNRIISKSFSGAAPISLILQGPWEQGLLVIAILVEWSQRSREGEAGNLRAARS